MKIGVLSDTHVSSLSPEVIEKLKSLSLDLIIHCGDFTGVNVVYQLRALGNFCGVAGNMDSAEIKHILREKEVIEVEGKRIGVVHRHGLFFSDRKMENRFQGEKIDIFNPWTYSSAEKGKERRHLLSQPRLVFKINAHSKAGKG
jgi:hypothetical protein